MEKFKVSASSCSDIMTNPKSKADIISVGAKTYCQDWLKKQIYGRRKEFSSKETIKGEHVELQAIELIGEYLSIDIDKNDEYFENDYAKGIPDVVCDYIIDNKSSWDCFTFPLFNKDVDKKYWWQGQVYMWLTGKNMFKLIYTLMNAPDFMIKQQAAYYCRNNNISMTPEIYDRLKRQMTYDNIPIEKRIKIYDIQRDDDAIKSIEKRVIECRTYINELL